MICSSSSLSVQMLLSRQRTFSCFRCFSNCISLNICRALPAVFNGSDSFFTATGCWPIWSLAELEI